MIELHVRTIDHDSQRYDTVGDWVYGNQPGEFHVTVSNMGNRDYEFCVAIHELVEAYLLRKRGVTQRQVDEFDNNFEANRPDGNIEEPGFDITAPYYKEHFFATGLEMLLAEKLNLNWQEYESTVNSLIYHKTANGTLQE